MKTWIAVYCFILLHLSATGQDNPIDSNLQLSAGKLIIINSFDAASLKTRKNRREFFIELTDSLKSILFWQLYPTYKERVIILPEMVKRTALEDSIATNSMIQKIMEDHQASRAIVIRDVNAFFNQTGVEVEGEKGDKSRKVSWDLCSKIKYELYTSDGRQDADIELCERYTTRNSMSGLLAFGPDIVGKQKDVYKNVRKNVEKLLQSPDLPVFSSTKPLKRKTRVTDILLKYSISFADQSQMVYDGSKLKTYINQPFIESGDVAYYKGHYFNSRVRYFYALNELPWVEQRDDTGFSNLVGQGVDSNELHIEYIKIYTRTITTIGMLFQTRGKYAQADKLLTRAMAMRLKWFGKESREYLNSLHNYAVLKKDMGLYEEADSLFNKVLPAFETIFGAKSYQFLIALNNRAILLGELGRTKEAIQLLDRALAIGQDVLSPDYIDYERILTNRALLEQEAGHFKKAEAYYEQAIGNMEKKEFEDHPDYNNVMVYYGSLRVDNDDPGAFEFITRAHEKVRRRYKENHPLTAKALSNIGDYYLRKKAFADARKTFEEVASIQAKVLTERHKDYLNTLMKLGVSEWLSGDPTKAAVHFDKAIQNYLLLLNSFFRSMSESEKTVFWRTLKPAIDTYFAFAVEQGKTNPALLKNAYDLQLRSKGILINSTKQSRNLILNSGDSTVLRLYNEWLNVKRTIANYYSSTVEELEEDKIDLLAIEQNANELEKELSRKSFQFNKVFGQQEVSVDDIKTKLRPGELAVEIIRIFHYFGDQQPDYVALAIDRDADNPTMAMIGKGGELEKEFLFYYRKCIINKIADGQSYDRYWKPLEKLVANHKTIFLSIDGVYNSISLNTLRKPDGNYLLDDYNLVLIPGTRSIINGLKPTRKSCRRGIDSNAAGIAAIWQ